MWQSTKVISASSAEFYQLSWDLTGILEGGFVHDSWCTKLNFVSIRTIKGWSSWCRTGRRWHRTWITEYCCTLQVELRGAIVTRSKIVKMAIEIETGALVATKVKRREFVCVGGSLVSKKKVKLMFVGQWWWCLFIIYSCRNKKIEFNHIPVEVLS